MDFFFDIFEKHICVNYKQFYNYVKTDGDISFFGRSFDLTYSKNQQKQIQK